MSNGVIVGANFYDPADAQTIPTDPFPSKNNMDLVAIFITLLLINERSAGEMPYRSRRGGMLKILGVVFFGWGSDDGPSVFSSV